MRRIIAAAVVATLSLGLGVSIQAHHTTPVPAGFEQSLWHVPVNPVGAPPAPPKDVAAYPADLRSGQTPNCYPSGTSGYQADCVDPGFEGYLSNPGLHWGNEPFYNTGRRYVWVVDELGATRARDWLQYVVNQFNSIIGTTAPTNARPYILYYKGEDLGWSGCSTHQLQTIEFCYQSGTRSITGYFYGGQHFSYADAHIGDGAAGLGDQFLEYTILHEFGHAFGGFAHNQDCTSVMTYCQTYIGNTYLTYQGNDLAVYVANYDSHSAPNG